MHEARLCRAKAEADDQTVRHAEAATVSVAAAAAASMGAQNRQANAAVAAAVAAGAHAQSQQAAAMAAQAAMFLEFQVGRAACFWLCLAVENALLTLARRGHATGSRTNHAYFFLNTR